MRCGFGTIFSEEPADQNEIIALLEQLEEARRRPVS
jgi:hypothetical protein